MGKSTPSGCVVGGPRISSWPGWRDYTPRTDKGDTFPTLHQLADEVAKTTYYLYTRIAAAVEGKRLPPENDEPVQEPDQGPPETEPPLPEDDIPF